MKSIPDAVWCTASWLAESLATLLGMKSSTAVQATIAWFRGKFLEKIKLGSLKE